MSERQQSKPIIDLKPLRGNVRKSSDGKTTFLDVTFSCAFAQDAEPLEGTSISIERGKFLTLEELAEAAYLEIGMLLAATQREY
jgi:hypothetical protein